MEQQSIPVTVLDLNLDLDEVDDVIAECMEPDVVLGASAYTSNFYLAIDVVRRVKEANPDCLTVMGGYHPTFAYNEIMPNYPYVDMIVKGEGEATAVQLAKELTEGGKLQNVEGLVFRKDGKIIDNGNRQVIRDLDTLPLPARHLLMMREYVNRKSGFAGMIQASRGCVYHCTFCQATVMEVVWRHRSGENVAAEMELLKDHYDVQSISFVDNLLTGSKKFLSELCDILKGKRFDLNWSCEARIENLSEDIAGKMFDAGCRVIFLGLESGYPDALRAIRKTPNLDFVRERVSQLAKMGFSTYGSFMIGFPWEDEEKIRRTIQFASGLDLTWAGFSFATPLHGTPMSMELPRWKAEIVDYDYSKWDGRHPVMKLPHISRESLIDLYLEAFDAIDSRGMRSLSEASSVDFSF